MYIENNVFENIFNTVMDVKGKTKDNIKARMNITLFCYHKNMELDLCRVTGCKAQTKHHLRQECTTTSVPMAEESVFS